MSNNKKFSSTVFLVGSLWAVVVLGAVLFLESRDFMVFGKFGNRWIPFGAGSAGIVAGAGYYLLARSVGFFPGARFVGLIAATGVVFFLLYLGTQYLFAGLNGGLQRGFLEWLQVTTKHSIMTEGYGNRNPEELGNWGYLYLSLEMMGFAVGIAIPPLCQSESAFCPACRRYMKKAGARFLHSSESAADIKKLTKPSWKAASLDVVQHLADEADKVIAGLKNNQTTTEMWAWLDTLPEKLDRRMLAAWEFEMAQCSRCGGRHVIVRRWFLDFSSKLDNVKHIGRLLERIYIPVATGAGGELERQPSVGTGSRFARV